MNDDAATADAATGSRPQRTFGRTRPSTPEVERGALTIVVNPIATTVTTKRTDAIRRALEGRYEVSVVRTEASGHATALAQEAAAGGAAVVAVYGGDGTANEVIRALAGTSTALAHLPGGNSSVLARMLGMGADGPRAARRIARADATIRTVDLGEVDGRPFAFTAGIGLDAAVVKLVDADLARKHRFRWGAFFMEAVRIARSDYLGAQASVEISSGGASARGVTAIVQNADAYTYLGPRPLTVGDGASLDSGTLAASALTDGLGLRHIPTVAGRVVGPLRTTAHPRIQGLPPSTEVVVTCDRPMPMQVDGDYWKDVTQATFRVRPGALRVLAPAR